MTQPDFNKLTDAQIRKLIRLRKENEKLETNNKITKINILERHNVDFAGDKYFAVKYRLYTKKWAPEESYMIFNKFYLNEFKELKKFGIIN